MLHFSSTMHKKAWKAHYTPFWDSHFLKAVRRGWDNDWLWKICLFGVRSEKKNQKFSFCAMKQQRWAFLVWRHHSWTNGFSPLKPLKSICITGIPEIEYKFWPKWQIFPKVFTWLKSLFLETIIILTSSENDWEYKGKINGVYFKLLRAQNSACRKFHNCHIFINNTLCN